MKLGRYKDKARGKSNMKPILKETRWGYNEPMEIYDVELRLYDENDGTEHFVNLSQFDRYQRLVISDFSLFDAMMEEDLGHADDLVRDHAERLYEPDKPNDYYDEFDHTGYRRAVKFACYVMGEFMEGRIDEAQDFIDEVTESNINTVYIPDVEGFVYKQKEIAVEESDILEKDTMICRLDGDVEAIDSEIMIMMDGYPVCLHCSYVFTERFYVAYSTMMAPLRAAMEYAGDEGRMSLYFDTINGSEMIASYEDRESAMRSEYRNYFRILSDMIAQA